MAAIAYYVLQRTIIGQQGRGSLLAAAIGKDWKGKLSPVFHLIAIPLAFVSPWIASGLKPSCGSFPTAASSACW
jgi:hypothetical protein